MKPDERAEALIALIESERLARCRETREPASREARELLAHARRAARSRVRAAIAEERAAYAARVASAQARLATARRMMRQRRMKALLAHAWERLPQMLAKRWSDETSRRQWIEAAQAHAEEVLPPGDRVCEIDPVAGVRIAGARVVVDATTEGLLCDRIAIEGRLLHHLEEGPA